MEEKIKLVHYEQNYDDIGTEFQAFGRKGSKEARSFHESIPGYQVTPLITLHNLADMLQVKGIYVKDESFRFGLNAFKGLGGSYCIARYIADKAGMDVHDLSYNKIANYEAREKIGDVTFVSATDGNHGRGIAWTAKVLGYKSIIFMPKGSSEERLRHIRQLGSQAFITDMNYDETVAYAQAKAEKNHWVLVQDTAWDGYEAIPSWIMQGYTTLANEAVEQLGDTVPTHIFLQAGVGAMSGALTAFFRDYYRNFRYPVITIVEPDQADCIFRTAKAADGKLHTVTGSMHTIMAGLSCGVPCTIGWNILSREADNFVSIPDELAAKGMRVLGNPLRDDKRIISGESGASTFGLFMELMQNRNDSWIREKLQIDQNSKLLFISTEGDTDRENYRRIVWDGLYPSFS